MPGRHAKPVDLILAEGNKGHFSKEELEKRKENEIKLGDNNLKCPDFIKNDEIAYQKWKELVKNYKEAEKDGIQLITSSDVGLLARYCKTFSDYQKLVKQKDNIEDDIDTLLRLENAINKKMDMLIKMEDRLFLNPLSKIKTIPKPVKEDKPVNKFEEFLQ